jgi:hypothetical protein
MKKGTIVEVIRNDGTADIHFLFYCDKYIPITSIDHLTPSMLEPCNGVTKMQFQFPSLSDLLGTGQVIPQEVSTMNRPIQRTEFMESATPPNWILVTPFPGANLFLNTKELFLNHIKIQVVPQRMPSMPMPGPAPAPAQPELFSVQDEAVSQCLYIQQGDQYHKVNRGQYYDMTTFAPLLRVLTCNGMFNPKHVSEFGWPIGPDGSIVVTLPPGNIVRCAFRLNQETTDREKRIEMTFARQQPSEFKIIVPVSHEIGEPLFFYQPTGVEPITGWSSETNYCTHLMNASLILGRNTSYHVNGTDYLFTIDAVQANRDFFHTMQDVHVFGQLSLPQCPMENVVAARFTVPDDLSDGVCALMRDANARGLGELFRLPYLYTINVATGTCVKQPIDYVNINRLPNEISLPYMDHERYSQLVTPEIEMLLMKNVMHQMGFTYSKMGAEFLQCPEHSMLIDFYVRRDQTNIGFHFDLTRMFHVSTLSLLFCMPDDIVRPGPMIAPIAFQAQPSVTPPPDVTTFTVKNKTCVMVGNAVLSHSTPDMTLLTARGTQTVPYEYTPSSPEFNFPDMWVSPAFSEEMERSKGVMRSFLRLWHVVSMREEAREHIGAPVQMFATEVFRQAIAEIMALQEQWLGARAHTCINVGLGVNIGPQTLSRALASAKIQGYIGGRQATKAYSKLSYSVGFSKTLMNKKSSNKSRVSPKRASTMSSMREKIRTKLTLLKSIITNADRDVIIGTALRRSSSRSSSRSSRSSSRGTRRASTGQIAKKQSSATRRRPQSL